MTAIQAAWRRLRARPGRRTLTIFAFRGLVDAPLALPDVRLMELAAFRVKLEGIARAFSVIPLHEGMVALRRGRVAGPAAALTFDGGFQSTHDHALPLLRSMGLPATCFLTTSAIAAPRPPWFARLHRALDETRAVTLVWRGLRVALARPETRVDALARLRRELATLPAPELEAEADAISRRLEVDPDVEPPRGSPWRFLDAPSILAMAASGAFAFGAASHHAAILSRMTPAAQREEIATSLCRLRELTRGPTDLFAYPGGEAGDWDENTKELLRELGVELAVTAVPGQCRRRTPRLELPRFVLQGDSELRTLW